MRSASAVPRALRAHALAAALAAGALLAGVALAALAAANDRLPGDLAAARAVQDWPFPGEPLADAVRLLTGTEVVIAIGAVLAAAAWLAGRRRPALAFAAGLAAVVLLQFLLKEIVDRPRPDPGLVDLRAGFSSASFPSGHAMSAAYLYGFLVPLALAAPVSRGVRAVAAAVPIVFLAIGGIANVWLGVHWPSDVIGGWLWALAVLIPAAAAARVAFAPDR